MVTGASTADAAIVLVDARKGVLAQTRRHSYLLALLGVREVCLAVNKMDLAGYSQATFDAIERDYREYAAKVGLASIVAIPVCATLGENVAQRAASMPWYSGPTLVRFLEDAPLDEDRAAKGPFRMSVQGTIRGDSDFRGYSGMIAGGRIAPGDRVRVLPSGIETTVARIVTPAADLAHAVAGQSVTVTLADEVDVSRGDMLSSIDSPAGIADQFEATIAWLGDEPLLRGRDYVFKAGARTGAATVLPLRYKVAIDTLDHVAAETLERNEIGVCEIELDRPIAFDSYDANRETGAFILIDRMTGDTVCAGMLRFALRRAANVRWQRMQVDKSARRAAQRHRSALVWLTGLPASGKSTLASRLEARLHGMGYRTYVLDGDNLRHGLNKDLGFTPADRVENIRRAGEVAKLMVDAGIIVIAAFISPFRAERLMVRELLERDEFVEVFVDTPLAVAEARDPKGLYRKARRGEIANFTGIGAPYEAPDAPDIHIDAGALTEKDCEDFLFERLRARGLFDPPT
jgi:bifunctional enzyme CysN/CysC